MKHNYGEELSKLVIRNMNVVEIAPKVVTEIEGVIFKGMNEVCKDYAEQQNFNGRFDMNCTGANEEGIEFYPGTDYWRNEDEIICSYYLDSQEGEDEDINWLTVLLGSYNNAHSIFAYTIDHKKINIRLKEYRNKLAAHYDNNPILKELGFRMGRTGTYIYLPFQLDKQILIDEYPYELDRVYDVVKNALETIQKAHNVFIKITRDIVKGAGYKRVVR